MKTTTYLLFILAIIVVAGVFLYGKSDGINGINGEAISDSTQTNSEDAQKITLSMKNGNYYPDNIKVKAGKPVKISLDKSVTGCFRAFTIRQLGLFKVLKTPEDILSFTPKEKGTYGFACSMGMGRGLLVVE